SSRHCQLVARRGSGFPSLSSSTRCSKTLNVIETQFRGLLSTIRSSPCGVGGCSPTLWVLHPSRQSTRTRLPMKSLCLANPPWLTNHHVPSLSALPIYV